ncbi:hypothetical protein ABVT39_006126 [Epinephelus coioides]
MAAAKRWGYSKNLLKPSETLIYKLFLAGDVKVNPGPISMDVHSLDITRLARLAQLMQLAELPLQLTRVLPLLPVSRLPGVTLQQTGITQRLTWPPNTLQRYTGQGSLQQPTQPPQQVTWLAQLPTGPLLTANLLLQASSISSSPALSRFSSSPSHLPACHQIPSSQRGCACSDGLNGWWLHPSTLLYHDSSRPAAASSSAAGGSIHPVVP